MKSIINYNFYTYFHSSKFLMPFLIYFIFLNISYSFAPLDIISSFGVTIGALFFLMTWVGFIYCELEDPVAEQLMFLKVGKSLNFYLSKLLFMVCISFIFSTIGILFPAIKHIIHPIFSRDIIASDIIIGFILHFFVAIMGSFLGFLLHPRIFSNRRIASFLTFAIAIMAYIKGPIAEDFSYGKLLTWMFPPLYDILKKITNQSYFSFTNILPFLLLVILYSIILAFIYTKRITKKGF